MPQLSTTDDLVLCCACGAQYEVTEDVGLSECRICEVWQQLSTECWDWADQRLRLGSTTVCPADRPGMDDSGQDEGFHSR